MPFDYTGSFSGSFTGDLTSTNGVVSSSNQVTSLLPLGVVSASAQITSDSGLVSSSRQINYRDIQNQPKVISAYERNSISANKYFRETTYPSDSASFDSRINGVGTDITALDARIDALSVGSGSADWATITNIPSGLVSGSSQITNVVTDTYISASAASSGFGQGGGTSDFTQLTNVPSGLVSGSSQITDVITDSYISASAAASGFGQGGGETYTAGNGISIISNVISINTSSAHFRLGVSGAAASYGFGSGGGGGSFGDPPVIVTTGFTITEFTGSGALVGTLVATDVTPGDTQTWATQSGYSDGYFSVSTDGIVRTLETSSRAMNTDNTPTSGSHPLLVQVTDGQNNTVTGTVYIRVTPNSAPVFRINGTGGSIVSNFTASLDESSSANTKTQYRIYVTDADSDAITIRTGSLGTDHFSFTIGTTGVSKYIDLVQETASLDYESQTVYSFVITASDANYEAGYNVPNQTHLEYRVEVVDNLGPGIQNQTITGVNENSSDGASAGTISATDNSNPANTIYYTNFTLVSAHSGSNTSNPNITSSLGGTSLYDPVSNPFEMNIAGAVTRKSSVSLNSDVANRYVYRVTVSDAYNAATASALVTIPIADDGASSIGTDGNTYYIQEGAETGTDITTNSNGYPYTSKVTFTSAVSQMWEVNTVPSGYVRFTNGNTHQTGSSVTLEVDTHISGNLFYVDSDTVEIQITASETLFETTKQYRDHSLTITDNQPYSIVFSDTSTNLNTNGARPSNTLTTITFTEPQSGIGDTVDHDAFTLTDPSGQLTASRSSDTYYVQPLSNLSGSTTYDFTASIADSYGNVTTDSHSIVIAQAPTGTLTENGTFYVIESATNGDNIVLGTNGRTGTQGDLGVSYSPQYNSAAVASFTSSNALISVASNGNLSVGTDISGSGNTDGDTITSNITWQDQFGNAGGPTSITVNITENFAPTATDTPETNNLNTNLGVDGAKLATLTWSDTEGDSLNISSFALSGTDASSLSSSYDGGNAFGIYANGDRSAGTLSYTASVEDTHGFSVGTYKDDITIAQADDGTLSVGTLYIIESATNGDGITTDTDGLGSSTSVSVSYSPSYGSPEAQNFSSTSPFIDINSSTGELTVGNDISGSANTSGDTISTTIGWEDQYGNTDSVSVDVTVTSNTAPSVSTDAPNTSNWNTNLAVDGELLATLVWSDAEGDALSVDTFNLTGTNAASFSSSYHGSNTFKISADGDLSAGSYSYSANVKDEHGFTQGTYSDNIVISQAVGGTITSEDFYIIESALSGALITTVSTGIAGTQGDVNVTYSPNYGTQVAEQFRTLHSVVHVDTNGNLSIKGDVSGSYTNGGTISPTIYWLDQYGNEGTGSITINVTNNVAPTATFTNSTVNAPVSSGTKLVTISISDTENDSPYEVTLSGAGADSMSLAPQNAASSSWFINASDNSMTAGVTLAYTASIRDSYGEAREYNNEFTVGAAPVGGGLWYLYTSEPGQYATTDEATYLTIYGDANDDGTTDSGYPFDNLTGGDIGSSTFTSTAYSGFGDTNTLVASGSILSGSRTVPLIENLNHVNLGFMIVFPSSSGFTLPNTMTNALGGSTSGEYVLFSDRPGTGALNDNPQTAYVRYFDLDSGTYPNSSATRFGVIFVGGGSSNITYFLMSSSGSAPASTQ